MTTVLAARHLLKLAPALLCLALPGCGPRPLPPEVPAEVDVVETIRGAIETGGGESSAAPVAAAEPTGFAKAFRGVVKLKGPAPANPTITVTKDPAVCGMSIVDPKVVAGPNGELKNVLVYVSSSVPNDPKWVHESYESRCGMPTDFDQKKCMFLSRTFGLWSAQTMRILNSDTIQHNTNLTATGFNQTIASNGSTDYKPTGAQPTPFNVTCSIHPWMAANMVILDHPYFAVTNDKGEFELPNPPAGVKLDIRFWHEATGFPRFAEFDGKKTNLSAGRFSHTFAADEELAHEVALDASQLK